MEKFTANDIWFAFVVVIVVLGAVLSVIDKITSIKKRAKEPEERQNDEIAKLTERVEKVEHRLNNDHTHLNLIDDSNRITQRALLALLSHGIDGNNIKQMEEAQAELQNHLINR